MASLNADAQAARVKARRVRNRSQALRLVVRGNLARSHERLEKAQVESDRARARRDEPLPSPWSELHWSEAHATFDQTLVPVD